VSDRANNWGMSMFTSRWIIRIAASMACGLALSYSLASVAQEMASFATGGYARGLRTKSMMHKIDTDGDGMVSHEEFIAYQTKIFDMMDKSTTHKGMLGKEEIMFATGGANRR